MVRSGFKKSNNIVPFFYFLSIVTLKRAEPEHCAGERVGNVTRLRAMTNVLCDKKLRFEAHWPATVYGFVQRKNKNTSHRWKNIFDADMYGGLGRIELGTNAWKRTLEREIEMVRARIKRRNNEDKVSSQGVKWKKNIRRKSQKWSGYLGNMWAREINLERCSKI